MKKITVIIACYNSEKTLSAAIASVCRQTFKDLEIIIVDDGSTDRSYTIACAYSRWDKRIRIIRHPENRGILAARKTGIKAACGEWIMHLDADDMLTPDACEKAAWAIREKKADFVQFGTRIWADKDIPEDEIFIKEKKLNMPEFYIDCNKEKDKYAIVDACYRRHKFTYTQWNKIYSAKILKKAAACMTDEKINMGEDMYTIFIVTSLAEKMAVIEDRLYIYRFGKGISCANKDNPWTAFERSCETMKAVEAVKDYTAACRITEEIGIYAAGLRRDMLKRTASRFYTRLGEEEKARAARAMKKWWTPEEVEEALEEEKSGNEGFLMTL